MARIKLTWDSTKHLFSFPVMILSRSLGIPGERATFTKTDTVMFVDSGSTVTSITETEASLLGIDIRRLDLEDIAGVGGITKKPIAKDLIFVALMSGSTLQATLDKVAVLPLAVKRKVKKNYGGYSERGFREGKMFSLCGLDLLEKWKGKLHLDLISKTGYIDIG